MFTIQCPATYTLDPAESDSFAYTYSIGQETNFIGTLPDCIRTPVCGYVLSYITILDERDELERTETLTIVDLSDDECPRCLYLETSDPSERTVTLEAEYVFTSGTGTEEESIKYDLTITIVCILDDTFTPHFSSSRDADVYTMIFDLEL